MKDQRMTEAENMSVRIKVSSCACGATENKSEVICNGSTVEEVLRDAARRYPNMTPPPFGENNELNPFVITFVNKTPIDLLQGVKTRVESGDEILIIPIVAGG